MGKSFVAIAAEIGIGRRTIAKWVENDKPAAVAETGAELARESFSPGDRVIGVDALCGLVYLLVAKSAGACWYFQNQRDYLRRMVARLDPAVLKKSVVIRRSSSVIWPSDQWLGVPLILTNGSPIAVRMDRGSEMILVYFLKNQ